MAAGYVTRLRDGRSTVDLWQERFEMADLIYTALIVGVFAVLTLVLRGVERL
jgi:hypothetical protein